MQTSKWGRVTPRDFPDISVLGRRVYVSGKSLVPIDITLNYHMYIYMDLLFFVASYC